VAKLTVGDLSKFPPHPLIAKMLATYGALKSLVALEGYIGPTQTPGAVRLYLDLDFRSYVEIPADQILFPDPGNADQNTTLTKDVDPTKIFVPASTKIEVIQVQSASVEASFLQGNITSSYPLGSCRPAPSDKSTRPTTCRAKNTTMHDEREGMQYAPHGVTSIHDEYTRDKPKTSMHESP
jgi:hypothetical protein